MRKTACTVRGARSYRPTCVVHLVISMLILCDILSWRFVSFRANVKYLNVVSYRKQKSTWTRKVTRNYSKRTF